MHSLQVERTTIVTSEVSIPPSMKTTRMFDHEGWSVAFLNPTVHTYMYIHMYMYIWLQRIKILVMHSLLVWCNFHVKRFAAKADNHFTLYLQGSCWNLKFSFLYKLHTCMYTCTCTLYTCTCTLYKCTCTLYNYGFEIV